MRTHLFFLVSLFYASSVVLAQSAIHIIPIPTHATLVEGYFTLPAKPSWYSNTHLPAHFNEVLTRLSDKFVSNKRSSKTTLRLLLVESNTMLEKPEAYTLEVDQNGITIKARERVGLYYGLQSLLQLKVGASFPYIQIHDSPRFAYRGIMLDVSRHFFSKKFVMKQLDAMASYKLNRLHLHLTDAAGWRLESKIYPNLTRIGAWRTHERWKEWWFEGGRKYKNEHEEGSFGGYYTQTDIREIVKYAAQRYITIIPEVEMPAHSEEVLVAYPHLSCAGEPYKNADFCAGNDSVFIFWEDLFREMIELFPSSHFHIGGDEAGKNAWRTCFRCQERMNNENLKNVEELQSYFIRRIEKIANKLGKQIIGWDEILEGGLPPNATVMSWRSSEGAWKATAQGNRAILTPGEFCYFDFYQDSPFAQPEAIGGYLPLEKVYSYNPIPDSISTAQATLIEGVQGNLWTEYVTTPSHGEMMLYPRALAIAEIGWSMHTSKDWSDFRRRTLLAIETLKDRGYTPFDLAREVGNRPESYEPLHAISVGKKVTYNLPYHPIYAAQGNETLTDGLRGGWTYSDKRWQGFIGVGRFDVVIDLDGRADITAVYADFMQSPGAEVYLPATFDISISDDNINFTPLHSEVYPTSPKELYGFRRYEFTGATQARYIRVRANSCSKASGWLFTDEVVIIGRI